MSNCKFVRIEVWARKAPHKRNSKLRKACMGGVLAELIREPHACSHLNDPKPPEILYGSDPTKVWDEAYAQADQAVDSAGANLKCTALVILVGVASYPVARSIIEREPRERAKYERWLEKTIAWLHKLFGARLKLIVAHHDEPYLHVHFAVLPTLGADRRLRIGEIHPGHRAEQQCKEAGGTRREQKKAHQQAMTEFQDSYYEDVGVEFGFARFGPRRQHFDRDAWKAQTKQLRALAEAREKLARDRHHIAAMAAAQARRETAAQVAASEAAAAQRIELTEQRALTQIKRLTAQNSELNAKLKHRDALLLKQGERLAALEAALAEQGLCPEAGADPGRGGF
jgi:hypothetical protein